ncbi:intraflagellar transport-associated protein-like isoform X1 [Montipora capricornis]|uniref:intraflagellar transport-associated protein-like isoform X1 n=1 Tax=Montipora capricornis TaxID=246305 RepID=UPI0035F11830
MAKGETCRNEEDNSPDLHQYAKDALDQLFNKEQQTYEEFLQSFTFLTKEDVTEQKSHSSLIIVPQNGDEHKVKKKDSGAAHKEVKNSKESQQVKTESVLEENDVSEEVLEPGSTTGSLLMRAAESSDRSLLQVDNFVDFEDETSGSEDTCTSQTNSKVDPVLEDDFLSGSYLPTVATTSLGSLKGRDVADMRSQLGYEDLKADFDKESPESREICYLSERVSNLPGEVSDEWNISVEQVRGCSSKVVVKPNIRELQISTRTNNSIKENSCYGKEGGDTDEVQTFRLDTDFDYDNITLTPKFSFLPKHLDSLS